MAVSSITSDYTGRKKDISILQYPTAQVSEAQTVSIAFGKNTRFCAGVQKLIQKYTVILLTNIGSQESYPDFGTSFLYRLKAGISSVDNLLASQIFRLASYITVNILKEHQTADQTIPADERIASASLIAVSMYGGTAAFEISITTETGTDVSFLIPLPK